MKRDWRRFYASLVVRRSGIVGRGIFSGVRIPRGEELTTDYGESQHNGKLPCRCGTAKCRGFI